MVRRHRRKLDDPLVPIEASRVRAAIEWKGLSVNSAAATIKVSQQTLDSIVNGQTKRCYQALRDKLAALVGLPATWLGGETDLLPTLTPWLPPPHLGYTPPLWVDEQMQIIRPAAGDFTQRTSLPPRYQLAAYELGTSIVEAWKRDIDQRNRSAEEGLQRLAVGRWKERPWDRVMMLVTRLMSAFSWQRLFLEPPPFPEPVDPKKFTDEEWKAMVIKASEKDQRIAVEQMEAGDQVAIAAGAILRSVLRPWLTGDQALDYKAFVDALEWASSGFGKNPSLGGT